VVLLEQSLLRIQRIHTYIGSDFGDEFMRWELATVSKENLEIMHQDVECNGDCTASLPSSVSTCAMLDKYLNDSEVFEVLGCRMVIETLFPPTCSLLLKLWFRFGVIVCSKVIFALVIRA